MADGTVRISDVAAFLAHSGVQWPYRSGDIRSEEVLKEMWETILMDHLTEKHAD